MYMEWADASANDMGTTFQGRARRDRAFLPSEQQFAHFYPSTNANNRMSMSTPPNHSMISQYNSSGYAYATDGSRAHYSASGHDDLYVHRQSRDNLYQAAAYSVHQQLVSE